MIDTLLINKADFDGIRQVSTHCSWDNLKPYILERQRLDLIDRLGSEFYFELMNNLDDEKYIDLLNGSTYKNCKGKDVFHYGLKIVLIHYSYSAYVIEHGKIDTPFGVVQKISQDSMPVPMSELRTLHDRNRRIGGDYFAMTEDYLLHSDFDLYKCNCNISCKCSNDNIIKTRRSNFKVIKKNN